MTRIHRARTSFIHEPVRKFRTDSGLLLLLEESHVLPLVDLQVTFRTGSVHDPEGKEGLTRLTAAMIRRGTRRMSSQTVEESIDRLGGHLSVQSAASFIHFSAVVLQKNVERFFALMGDLLANPAWRVADLEQIKRETIAEIIESCDDDYALAARHFRRFAFNKHPYGRPVIGTRTSVSCITRTDAVEHYRRHFVKQNIIVGAAGAITADQLSKLADTHLGGLSAGGAPRDNVPAPRFASGRRVLVVNKPERTQTQILIGTLGARAGDPDYFPLAVGNTIFGGTFTARLMKEIRSKRGWSYGASSRLGQDRQRDLWWMWAFPAARDAVQCIALELSLLEKLIAQGVHERELTFAKRFLTKSHALDIDTPIKRLSEAVEVELFGLTPDFYLRFVDHIRSVTRDQVHAALAHRLSTKNLAIVLVATANGLRQELAQLPGVQQVQTVPFDTE